MIAIKARFERQVRRTSFDKDQLDYSELTSTLSELFGRPLGDKEATTIRYLDDEGEWVDVSSDGELREALRLNKDKTVQLVVRVKKPAFQPQYRGGCRRGFFGFPAQPQREAGQPQGKPEGKNEEQKPGEFVHRAYCDACNQTIVGIRHKCEQCFDYDLCNKCIEKKDGVHDASHRFHAMERSRPFPHFFHRGAENFANHPLADLFSTVLNTVAEAVNQPEKEEEKVASPVPSVVEPQSPVPNVAVENTKEERMEPEEKVQVKEDGKKEQVETSPAVPKKEDEGWKLDKETLVKQLGHLESMGFQDREKNIQALLKHRGNIAQAVVQLLE